jgi:hypothetical protein
MISFPLLFFHGFGYSVLNVMRLERLLGAVGSRIEEAASLSDRTYIWEYAGTRLSNLDVAVFGEGPVFRDAQPALGTFQPGYRMPYHAAILDFIVVHGFFLGGLAILVIFRTMRLVLNGDKTGKEVIYQVAFLNLVLWLSISIMDSGLSNFETFCFAILPSFSVLLAPVGYTRFTPIAKQLPSATTIVAGVPG